MKFLSFILFLFIFIFSYGDNYNTTIANLSNQTILVSCGSSTEVTLINPSSQFTCPNSMYPNIKNLGTEVLTTVCTYYLGFSSEYLQPQSTTNCNNQAVFDVEVSNVSTTVTTLVDGNFNITCNNNAQKQLLVKVSPITCSGSLSQDITVYNDSDNDYNLICLFNSKNLMVTLNKNTHASCNSGNILEFIIPKHLNKEEILKLMERVSK